MHSHAAKSSRGAPQTVASLVLAFSTTVGSAPAAFAQAGTGFRFVPNISISEEVSNNIDLSPTAPLSDAITRITAGVSGGSRSGRMRGFLSYGLTANLYARNSDHNSNQNTLSASFDAEVIDGRAFVGVSASIDQTARSAFGPQPGLSGLPSTNVTELRTLTVTPRFNGPLGPVVAYTAGLGYTISDAGSTSQGDSTSLNGFVHLGPASPGVVGWAVDLTSTRTDFDAGRTTVDNRLMGSLSRRIDALDLLVNISGGAEGTDLASFQKARYWNYGIGATWAPSPRTKLVANLDERFFGRAHEFRVEHRTALTTWTISDTRSLNSSANGISTFGPGPTFDLYFAQFAAIEPDPAKRTDLVNGYLKANGLSASSGADSGYLRSAETVMRAQNVSVAYRGLRGAVVLAMHRSVDVPIQGAPSLPSDDFANTSNVVSDNVSLNVSHRLTPTSSANLTFSYQQSHGDQPTQYSNQREVRLQYVAALNDSSSVTAGARRALYKTYQTPYNESAAFATFGHRF
ncbi:MAG: TIGR03016 family PEP-CTERM system-associated outer membrane protein [Burkholderiaceae bacterium]|nr:TIGR03016 family PEP-CTERM system-associated outer membrane protein [Burkholderiaceae bacterium]